MKRRRRNPHAELCAWANGLREDSIRWEPVMEKYYVDGKSKPSIDPLDFDEPVGIYLADIVDEALAAKDRDLAVLRDRIGELIAEKQEAYESGLEKDRDLADANHALLLANNSADAFKRVAEQRQGEIERLRRAVEWCLQLGVTKTVGRLLDHYDAGLIVPAEFADIIKPTTGASNG